MLKEQEKRFIKQGVISSQNKTADDLAKGFYLDFSTGDEKFASKIQTLTDISKLFNKIKGRLQKEKEETIKNLPPNIGNYDRQKFINDIEKSDIYKIGSQPISKHLKIKQIKKLILF